MNKTYNRLLNTLYEFLKQGISPQELALAVALGVTIGMFPVQGTTTLICILVSLVFRLNIVVIQLANYLSIPLMMVMLVPFYTIGHHLFSRSPFTWNLEQLMLLFKHDFVGALTQLSWSIGYAVLTWLILAPLATVIIYFIALRILKRLRIQPSE